MGVGTIIYTINIAHRGPMLLYCALYCANRCNVGKRVYSFVYERIFRTKRLQHYLNEKYYILEKKKKTIF